MRTFIAVALCLLALLAAGSSFSFAQARPALLASWSATTYVPKTFSGRALPAAGATVTVSFELVEQGGKLARLSQKNVSWYVDDKFLQSGRGLQTVSFPIPRTAAVATDVRIQVQNYPGNELFIETISLPVARPEVVIETPFPYGIFRALAFTVKGVPYFFTPRSLSQLQFFWEANGVTAEGEENPGVLDIGFQGTPEPETPLRIGLVVQNKDNSLEEASTVVELRFQ